MYYKIKLILILTHLFGAGSLILCQDSLHLVKSITGTGENNMIFSVKSAGDVNGDGYKDLLVKRYLGDSVTSTINIPLFETDLLLGSADFDTVPDYTFNSCWCYSVGDVNNDGFSDIISAVSDYTGDYRYDKFFLYFGGSQLIKSEFVFSPPHQPDLMISDNITSIGDLTGDGYTDFAISARYNFFSGVGNVYLFSGGDTIRNDPFAVLSYQFKKNGTTFFGSAVVGIGDKNEDGYNEIIISSPALSSDSGSVLLFYGGEKMDSIPDKVYFAEEIMFGDVVAVPGDINGDGKSEIFIAGYNRVFLYTSSDSVLIQDNLDFGTSYGGPLNIGTGGDINNDGYKDYLVNAQYKDSTG